MADALAAKNSEIEALVSSMDALKKQAALSEGNLASLQVKCTFSFSLSFISSQVFVSMEHIGQIAQTFDYFDSYLIMFYQVNMESIMRNRELTETRMMQVSVTLPCIWYTCVVLFTYTVSIIRLYVRSWLLQNGEQKKSAQHIMLQKWSVPRIVAIF